MPSKREQLPLSELHAELVKAYFQTFFSRTDLYAIQNYNGSYQCVRRPLTAQIIRAHLAGEITLGAYALDRNSHARWLCLDADDEIVWQSLRNVAADLEGHGIACYRELSRRDGHLWLFLEPTPGKTARLFGKGIIGAYQLLEVEMYPKQDQLNTGPGSLVKAPFGVHRKSQMRYPFVDAENRFLAPTVEEHLARLCPPKIVPRAFLERLVKRGEQLEAERRQPSPDRPRASSVAPFLPAQALSERLKVSISVYEFASRYVALTPQGRGFCPFHDDQQMSFSVHTQCNFWHCFAECGGGSIVDSGMTRCKHHGQDGSFRTTIKELAQILL